MYGQSEPSCILTDRSVSVTVTYDDLPDAVMKKLLSNRHVVRFHFSESITASLQA